LITVATLHSAFSFKAAGRRAEADDRDEENEEGWSHESAQGDQRDSMCSDREPAADVTNALIGGGLDADMGNGQLGGAAERRLHGVDLRKYFRFLRNHGDIEVPDRESSLGQLVADARQKNLRIDILFLML